MLLPNIPDLPCLLIWIKGTLKNRETWGRVEESMELKTTDFKVAVLQLEEKKKKSQRLMWSGYKEMMMESEECMVNVSPFLFVSGWIKVPSWKTMLAEKPSSLTQTHDYNFFLLEKSLQNTPRKNPICSIYPGACWQLLLGCRRIQKFIILILAITK